MSTPLTLGPRTLDQSTRKYLGIEENAIEEGQLEFMIAKPGVENIKLKRKRILPLKVLKYLQLLNLKYQANIKSPYT